MAVTISSREELEKFLSGRPHEWAQGVAARIALRVLPLAFKVLDVPDNRLRPERKLRLILHAFRANYISWAACKYPAQEMSIAAAAAAAAVDAAAVDATAAYHAAAYAAADAARAAADAARATAAYATTATAAATTATAAATTAGARVAAERDIGAAISADCAWLEAGGGESLIDQPLWPVDVRGGPKYKANLPPWARTPLDGFADSEMARDTSWRLIVDWYRAILPSRPPFDRSHNLFDETANIAIATQEDEFWRVTKNRSADEIMDDVSKIAGWESEPKQGRKKTIASFIVGFLDDRKRPATIDQIRHAFASADYRIVDKTMRGELSRLAMAGRIIRVGIGVYTSANNDVEEIERSEEPTSVQQGSGPVFAAIRGELSRVPHYPFSDELANPTLRKLHDRINNRLKSLLAAFGNGLARYPQLGDTLRDYRDAISCEDLAKLDIDDLWISGAGLIAQARAFAALDPSKQVTEPLEPQLQALLGEIARLHGALIMGFAKGRELAERSGIPLLTADEFRKLYEYERTIVRWLLDSHQFEMSDKVKALFEEVDRLLITTSEGTEHLATLGYPIVRNLIIFGANSLEAAEKVAGRLTLVGVPVHLAVIGMLAFFRENLAPIMGFASSVPELRSYLEYHLQRLELEWEANERLKKK